MKYIKPLGLGMLVLIISIACYFIYNHFTTITYFVGVSLPLSGEKVTHGREQLDAITLMVEKINASKFLGAQKKLQLLVRDDQDNPQVAKQIAEDFVQQPNLLAVIGPYCLPALMGGAEEIYAKHKIVVISPYEGMAASFKYSPFTFSMNYGANRGADYIAMYLKEILHKDNVLVIHNNDAFGQGSKDAFVAKAKNLGLNVHKIIYYQPEKPFAADFVASNLTEDDKQKIESVVVFTHKDPGVKLVQQVREAGISALIMGPHTFGTLKYLNNLTAEQSSNVYLSSPFLYEIANEKALRFREDFIAKYNYLPGNSVPVAADAVLLLAEALKDRQENKVKYELALPQVNTNLELWKLYVASNGQDLKYTVKSNAAGKQNVSGIITQQELPALIGKVTDPINLAVLNPLLTDILKITTARGHTVAGKYANELSLSEGVKNFFQALTYKTAIYGLTGDLFFSKDNNMDRDVFASSITEGRFRVAYQQWKIPREKYVFEQLADRIAKGYIQVIDNQPFHVVNTVFLGIDFVKINDIDPRAMVFDTDLFVWFKWQNHSLDISKIDFINATRINDKSILKEYTENEIKYCTYKIKSTFFIPFDLTKFPFDYQHLPIYVAHKTKHTAHVLLAFDTKHMDNLPITDITPPEWNFIELKNSSVPYRFNSTFGDAHYRQGKNYKSKIYFSTAKANVVVKRKLLPYIFNLFLPLFVILAISVLILKIPVDQFVLRTNTTSASIMSILLYYLAQKAALPKVGYIMKADYYFILLFMFILVLQFFNIVVVQRLMSADKKAAAELINKQFLYVFVSITCLAYAFVTVFV